MLNVTIATILAISSINGKEPTSPPNDPGELEKYARCIREHPCDKDGRDLAYLPEEERHRIMVCRIGRHLQCSIPEKEDHVQNYCLIATNK